jgi:hypothetical protein
MIVCKKCGYRNADSDEFCANDGAFLEFYGEKVADDAPSEPAQTVAQPASRQPVPLGPSQPRPQPVPTQAPGRPRPRPGELVCGDCGWGNDPVRKFCRHCGSSLQDAATGRTPWYRRLLPRRRRLAAGERPRRLKRRLAVDDVGRLAPLLRATRNLVLVALAAAVAVYALLPPVRSEVNQRATPIVSDLRKTLIPHDTPVHPIRATASSELPGHGAMNAIDSFGNTYWAGDASGGKRPVLTLSFDQPVDIYDILFTSGAPDNFQAEARPRDLRVVFSDGREWNVTLKDVSDGQQFTFVAKHVDRVEIHVESVYPSSQGTGVALKKVEFFTRT